MDTPQGLLALMDRPAPDASDYAAPPTGILLRLVTCGSVDDGKSTLIGRLLWETGAVAEDQLEALAHDSRRFGTTGDRPDLALLVDGLESEREQGITIDVAYRTLTTPVRRLVIADAPGHEQYTRNMATGASTADLAIVLVNARKGLLTQTRRHSLIAAMMGVRHVVLAVNKMDLVGFDEVRFRSLADDYRVAVAGLEFATVVPIPLVASEGDNVAGASARMMWHRGPTLLGHLETVPLDPPVAGPFRMAIQSVNRLPTGRLYAGSVSSGTLSCGDVLVAAGSGQPIPVTRVLVGGTDRQAATAGDAVMLGLAQERDLPRGTVLAAAGHAVDVGDQFQAQLLWLHEAPMHPGRTYMVRLGTATATASFTRIRHRVDLETRGELRAETLAMNEVGVVNLAFSRAVPYEPFRRSRDLGGFIVMDRQTHATVGVGTIEFALRRAANIGWHETGVDRSARAATKGQQPLVVWFTGLSGAGKTTIADLVERRLHAQGRHTMMLDGDNVRHGLNRDLGFTEADRVENIRRISETAALMAEAGLIVLVSAISPYRAERQAAREKLPAGEFMEVFVDTPVEECRKRDPKGLYLKADSGQIRNFTGVDAPYEIPEAPDLHLRANEGPAADLALRVLDAIASGRSK